MAGPFCISYEIQLQAWNQNTRTEPNPTIPRAELFTDHGPLHVSQAVTARWGERGATIASRRAVLINQIGERSRLPALVESTRWCISSYWIPQYFSCIANAPVFYKKYLTQKINWKNAIFYLTSNLSYYFDNLPFFDILFKITLFTLMITIIKTSLVYLHITRLF